MRRSLRVLRHTAVSAAFVTAALSPLVLAPAVMAEPARSAPSTETVDLDRYAGTWLQLAAVPRLFEIQCAKNVSAVYGTTARGTVAVRNSCTTWLGTRSGIDGEALPLDAGGARFNVSFLRSGDGYRHGAEANYVVVGLGAAYEWAVVTDEDRRSGFLLSRGPRLDATRTAQAVDAIRRAGLDPRDFHVTRQDGGDPAWRLVP
ncbi:lipocalin family protein [Streptomyces sp. NPDC002262]|uniref:lipocalin family protein n=1 Tax=Streptomyces sp. NPDC002262 TaxID=3154414 RepID=UPI00331EFEAB